MKLGELWGGGPGKGWGEENINIYCMKFSKKNNILKNCCPTSLNGYC